MPPRRNTSGQPEPVPGRVLRPRIVQSQAAKTKTIKQKTAPKQRVFKSAAIVADSPGPGPESEDDPPR